MSVEIEPANGLRPGLSPDRTAVVRDVLQGYADRGVFRAFQEVGTRNGQTEFKILCFPFTAEPFTLVYADKPRTLTFKRLLKGMPARSEMYRQFKTYMKERSSRALAEHRRIDPARAELKWFNRLGNVSVSLRVTGDEHAYATRKAINLLTDVFHDLLTESAYYDYMSAHFDMPED